MAHKAAGREHGTLAATAEFDSDLERLEHLLQEADATSPLPAEAPNVGAIDAFRVRPMSAKGPRTASGPRRAARN